MKKVISFLSTLFGVSLMVLFSLHLMSSDKDKDPTSEKSISYHDIVLRIDFSGRDRSRVPLQSDLEITIDNSDEDIQGLNDPDKIDEFTIRLIGPTYNRVNTEVPTPFWETITMTETEKDSQIYKNSTKVDLVLGENAEREDNDGKLVLLSINDKFRVGLGEDGTLIISTGEREHRHELEDSQSYGVFALKSDEKGGNGTVSITQNAKVGESLTILVSDTDIYLNEPLVESVEVTVTTDKGETETVTLTYDSEISSGSFSAVLSTVGSLSAGASGDGSINVSALTVVTVSYTDALDENGQEATVTDEMTIGGAGVLGTISITDPAEVGDDLVITVTDADLNTDATSAQTIEVIVTSDKGESESVELTETGNDTGVFEGSIFTASGTDAGTDDDGTINAEDGTVITATYDDAVDEDGLDPEAVTAQVTLTEEVIELTFDTFVGTHVEHVKTIQYNGTTTDSGVQSETDFTAADYYCYGVDYQIYQADGDLEVWQNQSFDSESATHCSSGSELAFTNSWTIDGNTLSIDNGSVTEWTLEVISETEFKIGTLTGGIVLTERYYELIID